MADVDWSSTAAACQQRYGKAQRLAEWCWDQGLTWEHLEYATDAQWAELVRLALGRQARASERTRRLVQALLLVRQEWAAAYPTSPQARRVVRTPDQVAELLGPGVLAARR